jgi:hypothetical protein
VHVGNKERHPLMTSQTLKQIAARSRGGGVGRMDLCAMSREQYVDNSVESVDILRSFSFYYFTD